MRISIIVVLLGLLSSSAANAQPPDGTKPAPLVVASGKTHTPVFQFGAEGYGFQGGADYIGGVNASLLFRIADIIWVGLRPSAHYVMLEDTDYDVTWFHPDFTFQLNFLHDPVRLYLLGAGGFSVALDTDNYFGTGHGWSALGGVGVAWRGESPWGFFAELGFRIGRASDEQNVHVYDANGKPQCVTPECLEYVFERVTREYELTVFTLNIGLFYSL